MSRSDRMSMDEPSATRTEDERPLVDLMGAYQRGDLHAFEQLYGLLVDEVQRYFTRVHRDRSAVRDLVQDLFLEMHRSRRTYTPPLPVRPWIFGIARNICARSRRATPLRAAEPLPCDAEGELAMTALASDTADVLDIENALGTLPASTREPWLLHHVFGLSFDSIATRLGITTMAAKLRSSRATRALRLALRIEPRRP